MRPLVAQPFDPALGFVVSMHMDVVDLRNFYAHPLGTVARRFVGRGIRRLWSGSTGLRVLGVGYSTPYLGLFREDAERCLAFMPATQGVMKWPTQRPTLAALVDEAELPLPEAACSPWCRTGAGCGRAWTPRRSATGGLIRARRSRSCSGRRGSRQRPGA